jgi:hypothetical protein
MLPARVGAAETTAAATEPAANKRYERTNAIGVEATSLNIVGATAAPRRLDFFERYLSLWVFLCMVVGVAADKLFPVVTGSNGRLEFVKNSHVNAPIADLIWLMIYPMMSDCPPLGSECQDRYGPPSNSLVR